MRIHIFGNCQSTALMRIIREDNPGWTVSNTAIGFTGDDTPDAVAAHVAALARADVVITQPVQPWKGKDALSIEAVRALSRPGATVVVIPSLYFEGQHPGFQYLADRLQGFGMPYHNVHVVDMLVRGYRRVEIVSLLRSPDFYDATFVHGAVQSSLKQLRSRERKDAVDVPFSGLLEEACQSGVPMNTINHPKRVLLVRLLNIVYRSLGFPPMAREDGPDYLDDPVIPPLPSVLHHLGLDDRHPFFDITGQRYSRDDYTVASLAYYGTMAGDGLAQALGWSRIRHMLEAFGSPGTPASNERRRQASEWLQALFTSLMGRRLPDNEVELHLGGVEDLGVATWVEAFSETPELRQSLRRRLAASSTTTQGGP